MNTLFTQDSSNVLAVGAGALGCMAARFAAEASDESSAVWSAAHVDSAELIATGLERKLFLKMSGGPFAERTLSRYVQECASALARFSRGRDAAIVCGELSDSTAVQLIVALSEALTELNVPVFALLVEPFSFDGEKDSEALNLQRDQLAAHVPFVAFLKPGLEHISMGVAVKRIRKLAAERLACAAGCLASALDSADDHAQKLLELRGVHCAAFSTATNESSGAPGAACDRALSAFDEKSRGRIDAAIVSSVSEISFREARIIAQKLPARAALIATTNPALEERAECLILCGEETAANVVSIHSLGFRDFTTRDFVGAGD